MTQKDTKRGRGKPPKFEGQVMTKTLSGVRVSDDQLLAYQAAADLSGLTRSQWITQVLDRAARRATKG